MPILGGETPYYFSLALIIGILFGIYSSVLVASPLVFGLVFRATSSSSRKRSSKAPTRKARWSERDRPYLLRAFQLNST